MDTGDDEGDDGDEADDIEEPLHKILDEGSDGYIGKSRISLRGDIEAFCSTISCGRGSVGIV